VESFASFSARKTREALSARLASLETIEDDSATFAHRPIGNTWTREFYDGPFHLPLKGTIGAAPFLSLVFVQSSDGNTGTDNPEELGGGPVDRHLIYEGLSRVAADAVLAGAKTAGDENTFFSVWHPELVSLRAALGLPRHPVQIIATLQGLDLQGALLFNVPDVPVVLLTVASCSRLMHCDVEARPWISVIEMPSAHDLPGGFAELNARGIRSLSVIGGRKLAGQLIDAGLVQDLYLTTSPIEAGEPNTPLYPKPIPGEVVVRKRGTGPESGVVFEHLVLRRLSSRRHEDPRSTR